MGRMGSVVRDAQRSLRWKMDRIVRGLSSDGKMVSRAKGAEDAA